MANTANYPDIIYGTAWKEDATKALVTLALETGYRAIDSANQRRHYFEAAAGEAVAAWLLQGNDRSGLFLQSKFTHRPGQDHRLPYNPDAPVEEQVLQSFTGTLAHYGTDYLDSFLIHGPSSPFTITDEDFTVWQTMEELYTAGKVKSIGISNVTVRQLKQLHDQSAIKPMAVQNRCYANRGWDREVRDFCLEHKIRYQGFSLLTANPQIFGHPVVRAIARKQARTEAQVILAFARQAGMTVLTGTTSPEHMREDLEISRITFTSDEMAGIAGK